MITINKLTDLERFGIFYLTSEADNLAYRALCDVSQRGKDLLREVYGMDANSPPANSETNGEKHVASVMLPYDAWTHIAPIGLLDTCHTVFAVDNRTVFGMQGVEGIRVDNSGEAYEYCARCEGGPYYPWPSSYGKVVKFYAKSQHPHIGTLNTHAMTGR